MSKTFVHILVSAMIFGLVAIGCATSQPSEKQAQPTPANEPTTAQPASKPETAYSKGAPNQPTEPTQNPNEHQQQSPECSTDADCVPATCCHPKACVPRAQAPECRGVICTMDCRGPIDCGRGRCVCNNGKCEVFTTYKGIGPNQ